MGGIGIFVVAVLDDPDGRVFKPLGRLGSVALSDAISITRGMSIHGGRREGSQLAAKKIGAGEWLEARCGEGVEGGA